MSPSFKERLFTTALLAIAAGSHLAATADPLFAQVLAPRTPPAVESTAALPAGALVPVEPAASTPYQMTASIRCRDPQAPVYLVVSFQLAEGSYLYALTQEGPMATKIEVAQTDRFRIVGPFRPSAPPRVIERDPLLEMRVEKHSESVEFFLPIEIADPRELPELEIDVRLNGQVCTVDGVCLPLRNRILSARFRGYAETPAPEEIPSSRATRR